MKGRAIWKGHLVVGELACAVSLHAAATEAERISFHIVNRKTGNRVRREFVDSETGKPVEREDQVKGYDTGKDDYVVLEPEEIAETVPEGDKRLSVDHFIPCDQVDTLYFDRPYYLRPADEPSEAAFSLIREGMAKKGVAAFARAVLFRRARSLLIRPRGCGLLASTMNFSYEVLPAETAFEGIGDIEVEGEMLELAQHIIDKKTGKFDPSKFDDRYDAALAELVSAKAEGRRIEKPERKREGRVIDLLEALRKSAREPGKSKKAAGSRRKAG